MGPYLETLASPPPDVPNVLVSFPSPHVVLVTLNNPKRLNAIPSAQHAALDGLWRWYDAEPSLRCAVITGAGRAFCAGADLKEWNERHGAGGDDEDDGSTTTTDNKDRSPIRESGLGTSGTVAGFAGLSNRTGKKPVVAAVNGLCLGGGMEVAINCDLVVASASARFGLPEVTRGVIALAGALPRLVRTVGRQRAAEMALLGGAGHTAEEMARWGLVNRVVTAGAGVGDSGNNEAVVAEAVRLAGIVAGNSPDAVMASREGLRLGWEPVGPVLGTELLERGLYGRIDGGENMVEGVLSFVEKRKAVWRDSKL